MLTTTASIKMAPAMFKLIKRQPTTHLCNKHGTADGAANSTQGDSPREPRWRILKQSSYLPPHHHPWLGRTTIHLEVRRMTAACNRKSLMPASHSELGANPGHGAGGGPVVNSDAWARQDQTIQEVVRVHVASPPLCRSHHQCTRNLLQAPLAVLGGLFGR